MSTSNSLGCPRVESPPFIYGTGSFCDHQDELILKALRQGYSAIDTGPTPAYREELTASGIRQALSGMPTTQVTDIFIQTKISPPGRYQTEESIPFGAADSPKQQASKSFERSKKRFSGSGCAIRALLLHAPLPTLDLTMQYWEAMEGLVDDEADLEFIGICNVTLCTLQYVYHHARIKPAIVQNSFRAASSFDKDVISFCRENGLVYQAYGVLTSNVDLLSSKLVGWFAETNDISEAEALFVLVSSFGRGTIRILHASHDEGHMAADLDCLRLVGNVGETILEAFEQLLTEICSSTGSSEGRSWSY